MKGEGGAVLWSVCGLGILLCIVEEPALLYGFLAF